MPTSNSESRKRLENTEETIWSYRIPEIGDVVHVLNRGVHYLAEVNATVDKYTFQVEYMDDEGGNALFDLRDSMWIDNHLDGEVWSTPYWLVFNPRYGVYR